MVTQPIPFVLKELIDRLITGYQPHKIVLFGSYATGQADENSDLDLLIIQPTNDHFLDRLDRVREVVSGAHRHIPFDPIVFTPDEIQARLQSGDQFIQGILEQGQVLYAAERN